MRVLAAICLYFAVGICAYGQGTDTFRVLFPLNDSKLSAQAQNYIDSLIFKDALIHGQKFIVLGYADYLGDNPLNNNLSETRARNVKKYMVSMGFNDGDIKLCTGKGKIDRSPTKGSTGYPEDRKVEIIIDHETETKTAKGLDELKVNETIALRNITFKPGSPEILPESAPELQKLLGFLNSHKTVKINIEGHVCCLGNKVVGDDQEHLSLTRARAIYDYLVSRGIDKNRLRYVGLGNANPIAKEEKNRRRQDYEPQGGSQDTE